MLRPRGSAVVNRRRVGVGEQCSQLCGNPSGKTPGHVVAETAVELPEGLDSQRTDGVNYDRRIGLICAIYTQGGKLHSRRSGGHRVEKGSG